MSSAGRLCRCSWAWSGSFIAVQCFVSWVFLGLGFMCLAQAWFACSLSDLQSFSVFSGGCLGCLETKVAGDLSSRAGFRGGRYLDFRGCLKLLSSPHLRGGDKGLLPGILSGCVWNVFLLSFVRGEIVPCRFCGGS